jgi:hypothetical protein
MCEYCRMPQQFDPLAFQIDHIIAQQHNGPTIAENLALSCFADNHHKGPNIAGIDPDSGRMERLFHPRTDSWPDHFEWRGAILFGRTSVGRTTIAVLRINLPHHVAHRTALIDEGVFPS